MESHHIKRKKETTEKASRCSNLLQKNGDYMKTCVISESSDSEEDKKDVRRCLHLSQHPNRAEIEKNGKKRASVSQTDCYIKCNSEHFPSSSTTFLEKTKQVPNNDNDIMPKNTEDKHLWTLKKHNIMSDQQRENTIISDSDTDSSSSKYNSKRLPRKNWTGPDIRLNLKDLGLNKQLSSWIEFIQQKPVMSTIPVSFLL